ncbi:MAG: hypothetical protein ACK56F_14260, partial [bacterium]
ISCSVLRGAMCMPGAATSNCYMLKLSYSAGGRDKAPSMTSAVRPSLHSMRQGFENAEDCFWPEPFVS